MKWLDKYKNKNGILEYAFELILADVIKELIELIKEIKEMLE
jgi:hypothetical protein